MSVGFLAQDRDKKVMHTLVNTCVYCVYNFVFTHKPEKSIMGKSSPKNNGLRIYPQVEMGPYAL